MRVLFLHHTFPGPFRHLAAQLAARPDTTALFLSERGRRDIRLPGVRRLTVSIPRDADGPGGDAETARGDAAEHELRQALRRAAATANTLLRLRRDGFVPDVIYASTAAGSAFYVQDIFPRAFFAVHADWYYTQGANYTFFTRGRERPPADFAPARIRNLLQLNALTHCHMAVTSTRWQRQQYPPALAAPMRVLHEGVDTALFSPLPGARFVVDGCDLSGVRELVTFSGRGAEAFRGFPQFYACLPRLLRARPRCHVLIMSSGLDQERLQTLRDSLPAGSLDESRIHTMGFRPVGEYRQLLRASTVHVYLTAPFALSSNLFEALSCGCLLAGSDTEPVREVIRPGENGFLCDFWDTDALADTVADLLERAPTLTAVRAAARQTILRDYDVRNLTAAHLRLLLDSYADFRPSEA